MRYLTCTEFDSAETREYVLRGQMFISRAIVGVMDDAWTFWAQVTCQLAISRIDNDRLKLA